MDSKPLPKIYAHIAPARETEVREALSVLRHIVKTKALGSEYVCYITPEIRQKLIAAAQPEKT